MTKLNPCMICGKKVKQMAKAIFYCKHCDTTYIAKEKDMRESP